MKKEEYLVEGMHCAACSASVERVTRRLEGVQESDVNLITGRLSIYYDPEKASEDSIIETVRKAGFDARLLGRNERAMPSSAPRQAKTAIIASLALSAVLLMLSMGPMLFHVDISHPMLYAIAQCILALSIMALGHEFYRSGLKALVHFNPNMDSLVAIGSLAAFIYSLFMTFQVGRDPHAIHQLYYESAAIVVALVGLGKSMEASSKKKTTSALEGLINLAPRTAVLLSGDNQLTINAFDLKSGDLVLVAKGSGFPSDGIVEEGFTQADQSLLTGESLPVDKAKDDRVYAGTMNLGSAVKVRVDRGASETLLSKIIDFVSEAQGKKAPISSLADKISGVFVPIVMVLAVLGSAAWMIFAGKDLGFAIRVFTSALVIACPCAMGLATPTAIVVGTGLGARNGILIKSGEALQKAGDVDTVVFDKTGTLTKGKPSVSDIIAEDPYEALKLAASLEALSSHPLAQAIVEEAKTKGVELDSLMGTEEPGKGMASGNLKAGSRSFVGLKGLEAEQERLAGQGKATVLVSRGEKLIGLIGLSDSLKEGSKEAVASLRRMGKKVILLSGDSQRAAEYLGSQLEVDQVKANVLPQDKAGAIEALQKEGRVVMMVGDGINDASALVQADASCAVATGSDIAMGSADIVLMKSDVRDVEKAIKLSRMTMTNIKENLFWAFFYNAVGIPIALGAIYPAFGILMSPMLGALAMSLSSVFVVSNALRLKTKKL